VRDLTYPPIIAVVKSIFRGMGVRFDVSGTEHIPRRGGAVLAVNHISYVDFVFAGYAAERAGRKVRFMSKRELFDHRWTGPLMRSLHHIEVDRADGARSYRTAVEFVRAGELVGVFPEATISRSFELKDFKSGAVRLASDCDVPLVPLVLWGTQRMLTKDHPRDFSRGRQVTIRVGAPLYPGTDPQIDTAALRAAMSRLLDEAIRGYPDAEPGAWWLPVSYGGNAPTRAEADRLDEAERARRREQVEQRRRQRAEQRHQRER
jgi:1-acyl-sn-glycerol-3-phosphate acyltransferase